MFLKEHCARFGIQRTFLSSYPGSCQQSSWIITENKNGGWGGDGENGRALLSAAVRICLTILFPCSCRTFRRKIMLAVMTRSLDAINRQKCALILVVRHPIDGFVHDLYNDRKYCTRSRMCGEILSPCWFWIFFFFLFLFYTNLRTRRVCLCLCGYVREDSYRSVIVILLNIYIQYNDYEILSIGIFFVVYLLEDIGKVNLHRV